MHVQSVSLVHMFSTVAVVLCESGSLVPRPPPFLPSVCVHTGAEDRRKMGTAWERGYESGYLGKQRLSAILFYVTEQE